MIVYVSIGNSDGKLSQEEWANFWMRTAVLLTIGTNRHIHGEWLSSPQAKYQNACWCIEFPGTSDWEEAGRRADGVVRLREALQDLARDFRQDSITWAEAETEFLKPTEGVTR